MLLRISSLIALSAVALVAQPGGVKVGDLVQHQFREAPLNAGGVKSLQELRGMPVLIEFWGRN